VAGFVMKFGILPPFLGIFLPLRCSGKWANLRRAQRRTPRTRSYSSTDESSTFVLWPYSRALRTTALTAAASARRYIARRCAMSLATRVIPQALSVPDVEETNSDGIDSKTSFT